MYDLNTPPPGKDPQLWELAKKRASFQANLASYGVMSVFFWVIWYFTGGKNYGGDFPWPIWPMLGWGIGLVFHYLKAYGRFGERAIDKQYDKLSQSKNK